MKRLCVLLACLVLCVSTVDARPGGFFGRNRGRNQRSRPVNVFVNGFPVNARHNQQLNAFRLNGSRFLSFGGPNVFGTQTLFDPATGNIFDLDAGGNLRFRGNAFPH